MANPNPNPNPGPGPGLTLSLVILSVGFVLAMAGSVLGIQEITESQTSPIHQAPGSIEQNFDPGEYDLYGESLDFRQLIEEDGIIPDEFDSSDLTVTGPSGQQLAIRLADPELVTNRGFTLYTHAGSFEVVEEGTHTVDVETAGATTFVVAESVTTAWRDAIPWIILGVAGFVLLLAGVVMLVVGIVRRQRAQKNQPPEAFTPGQFPPPASQPHASQPHAFPPQSSQPPASSPPPPPSTANPSSF